MTNRMTVANVRRWAEMNIDPTRKIEAIKYFREYFKNTTTKASPGLKGAKEMVELFVIGTYPHLVFDYNVRDYYIQNVIDAINKANDLSDPVTNSANPFKVGDVVRHKSQGYVSTVAALGNYDGDNTDRAVKYTDGCWDYVDNLVLDKPAPVPEYIVRADHVTDYKTTDIAEARRHRDWLKQNNLCVNIKIVSMIETTVE